MQGVDKALLPHNHQAAPERDIKVLRKPTPSFTFLLYRGGCPKKRWGSREKVLRKGERAL